MAQEQLGSLVVNIEANMKNLQENLNEAADKVEGFGSKVTRLGGVIAGLAAGGALVGFLKQSVADATEAENAMNALNAVITSTGGKAGMTADAAESLADGLEKVTNFSKESILGGESLLLTFTSIGKEVFPQATETALNMSQALGQDMKSSSIQLGKALNDPINGMTALSRVGVSFTEEQKKTIKTLQESGDIMGAQKVILGELSTEFGGAAKAAGQTFAGQMKQLDDAVGEVRETIGVALMPALLGIATWVTSNLPVVTDFIEKGINEFSYAIRVLSDNSNILIPILVGVTAAIAAQSIIGGITGLYKSWQAVSTTMTAAQWLLNAAMNANPFGIVAIAIGALVAAGVALYQNWDYVKEKADELWTGIKNAFVPGVNFVIDLINKLRSALGKPLIARVEVQTTGAEKLQNIYSSGAAVGQAARNANGTDNFKGGFTWVGEKGPELLNLPKGSQITPNKESMAMMGQSVNYENMFNGAIFNVRSDSDAKLIAREIYNLQKSKARGSGVVYG